jgi:hypothetical protein
VNNKSVDLNNNTEANRKALEDEVDNLVEELLRIGDGKVSVKSHAKEGNNKSWKTRNSENLKLNISDEHHTSRYDMNDRTPISTSSKSKTNLGEHSDNPKDSDVATKQQLHVSSSQEKANQSTSHEILNEKASNYYNGVLNREVEFSSTSQTFVRDPVVKEQQSTTSKKTKKSNFTYRSDFDADAIIDMNDQEDENETEVTNRTGNRSVGERIKLINLKVSRVLDEENVNNESTSSKRAQTFYNGQKVWTAATEEE